MRRPYVRNRALACIGFVSLASFAILATQCTFIANADLKAGIGQACKTTDDCQASICDRGVCTTRCAQDTECVLPNRCFDGLCRAGCRQDDQCASGQGCVNGTCANITKVVALLPGGAEGEDGWSTSHRQGLDQAAAKYASVLSFDGARYALKTGLRTSDAVKRTIDETTKQGAQIAFTASDVGAAEALNAAPGAPGVKFINMGAETNGSLPNVGAYRARTEQGWYAAGRIAARVVQAGAATDGGAPLKCIGMILPNASRRIVRETNAFARGARAQVGDVKIVIRWLGDTKDPNPSPTYSFTGRRIFTGGAGPFFREELLAAQLLDLGCNVVGHRTETQRLVSFVEKKASAPFQSVFRVNAFSMGVDFKDACRDGFQPSDAWIRSCLGVPYWNWTPIYDKVLDEILRGVWAGTAYVEPFRSDASAAFKYQLSEYFSVTGVQRSDAETYVTEAANMGLPGVFKGPLAFNGQRDLDRDNVPDGKQTLFAGETVREDDELDRMCWFIDGVYELKTPATWFDPAELIPAMVPYGPPVAGQTTTLEPADRTKYGDVIDFLTANNINPATKMSCKLN
jgi:basic membrane lipoprotein Med (substrate-binding protein (PBP1-ABC) superfamily)